MRVQRWLAPTFWKQLLGTAELLHHTHRSEVSHAAWSRGWQGSAPAGGSGWGVGLPVRPPWSCCSAVAAHPSQQQLDRPAAPGANRVKRFNQCTAREARARWGGGRRLTRPGRGGAAVVHQGRQELGLCVVEAAAGQGCGAAPGAVGVLLVAAHGPATRPVSSRLDQGAVRPRVGHTVALLLPGTLLRQWVPGTGADWALTWMSPHGSAGAPPPRRPPSSWVAQSSGCHAHSPPAGAGTPTQCSGTLLAWNRVPGTWRTDR